MEVLRPRPGPLHPHLGETRVSLQPVPRRFLWFDDHLRKTFLFLFLGIEVFFKFTLAEVCVGGGGRGSGK